jgi:integrase-like protein
VEGAKITLNEYLDRWLKTAVGPRVRPKTFQDYQGMLHRYVRPVHGERILAALPSDAGQTRAPAHNHFSMVEGMAPGAMRTPISYADRPCRPTGEFMPREGQSSGSLSLRGVLGDS